MCEKLKTSVKILNEINLVKGVVRYLKISQFLISKTGFNVHCSCCRRHSWGRAFHDAYLKQEINIHYYFLLDIEVWTDGRSKVPRPQLLPRSKGYLI